MTKLVETQAPETLPGFAFGRVSSLNIPVPGPYKHDWCKSVFELEPDDLVHRDLHRERFDDYIKWLAICPVCGMGVVVMKRKKSAAEITSREDAWGGGS